ncbi:uncharacterized protein A4U43_C01F5320 [Asparagus officinalis]|uniref:Uncharacterized protein n=1 Tax=Asparagus officinalis TaxID=4686 RepID=A0A5P1FLZ0_ASPOF|nr:uncharacterized protein A4U43_C01F5320 [Asparagus officinalis]
MAEVRKAPPLTDVALAKAGVGDGRGGRPQEAGSGGAMTATLRAEIYPAEIGPEITGALMEHVMRFSHYDGDTKEMNGWLRVPLIDRLHNFHYSPKLLTQL